MPRINFVITGDNTDAINKMHQTEESAGKMATTLVNAGKGMEQSLNQAGEAAGVIGREMQQAAQSTEQMAQAQQQEANAAQQSSEAHTSLRQRLREITQQMAEMRVNGEQDTETYHKLANEAGVLKDAMADANEEIKNLASDTRSFDVALQGVSVATGVMTTATGAMEFFGVKSEEAAEAQKTLQAAIAMTTGLQSIQTAVQSQSALMTGIAALQKKALTVAEELDTAAKGKNVIATYALTAAQRAFNAAANANPYVLLATALITVVGAIWALKEGFGASAKAQEEEKKRTEEATQALEKQKQARDSINSSIATQMSKYSQLKSEWEKLKTSQEKNAFIKNNKSAFDQLGVSINNVGDAESYLVKNTDKVVQAFILRGKAAAQAARSAELWKQYLDEADKVKNTVTFHKYRTGDKWANINDDVKNDLRSLYGSDLYAAGLLDDGGLTDKGANAARRIASQKAVASQRDVNAQAKQNMSNIYKKIEQEAKATTDTENKISSLLGNLQKQGSGKGTGKGKSGGNTPSAEDIAEANAKIVELRNQQAKERERQEKDIQDRLTKMQIDNMADGEDKRIAQLKYDAQREKEELQRQADDAVDAELKRQKDLFDAKEESKKKQNSKYQKKQFTTDDVDTAAIKKVTDQYKALQDEQVRANEHAQQLELDSKMQKMDDYLKAYGSMQQQREAITREYNRKIAAATSDGERLALKAELEKTLKEFDTKNIKDAINWDSVFSDLSSRTKTYLQDLRKQLQEVIESGKLTSIEDIKLIQEKIREIDNEVSKKGGLFNFTGEKQREQNRLNQAAQDANSNKDKATADVLSAEALLDIMKRTGASSEKVAAQEVKLEKAREALTKATKDAVAAENAAKRSASQSIADWFADAQQFIAEKGIDQIPTLLGQLGQNNLSKKVQSGIDGFGSAAGAAADFASGNYIGALTKGISAIESFGSALGISQGNEQSVKAANEKLESAMTVNTKAIDNLTDTIKQSNPTEATAAYKEAVATMQANEKMARQTMLNNASQWSSGGHSLQYDFNQDNGSLLNSISAYLGKRVSSLQDVLNLDAQTLNKFYETEGGRNLLTQLTQAIKEAQDSHNYNGLADDLINYMSTYSKEAYDGLAESLKESITGTSFDSFKDSFKSALMDMEKDSSDFANDFTKQLTQSVINAQIEKLYGKELEKLYNDWAEALGDDNNIDASELEALTEAQNKLTQDMIATRDAIVAATGYDTSSSQKATAEGIKSITADQADQLVGRITAMQIAVEQSKEANNNTAAQITTGVNNLLSISTGMTSANKVLSDMLLQMQTANGYLYDISDRNKKMYNEWSEKLDNINANIKAQA